MFRGMTLITFVISLLVPNAALAQVPPRSILKMEMKRDGCSAGNHYYQVRGGTVDMKVMLCKTKRATGFFERTFPTFTVARGSTLTLGCQVDAGTWAQRYEVHWQENAAAQFPQNTTDAVNNLIVYKNSCRPDGTCTYFISNRHNFKRITVNYTFRNQTRTEPVPPQENLLMLGFGSAPVINRASFARPYHPFECSDGDYPNIPVVP